MTVYTISDHTADEYRAMAQDERNRSAESFDRCDTDGFLSQWAHDSMAHNYRHLADLVDNGGDVQEIAWPMILEDEGNWRWVDEFRYVKGQYGESVRIWHEHKVHWWNPSRARKAEVARRNDEKKGFRWALVKATVEAYTYSAGMNVALALRPVTDDSSSILETVKDANY
ncbi:hypothetical protein SEA_MSCARN_31 [Gordonia phage MScarn]|uniref:Uncharacterized protein n=1 Tax=Gordonia phage MScarn TaxID=2836043 RepID=A0A8F3EA12_9CAUD|nr:hypothetical protein SEA_MSCARN_31 [Gordonia phage MScarn]